MKMFDSRKFLFVCVLPCSVICLTSEEIRAKPGDDVILQCRGPREEVIHLLEWTKPDLKSEEFVFFFRDERVYERYQHPLFRGRVELRDPQMKEGNFDVILKNVAIRDTGKYECYYRKAGSRLLLISSITLTVRDSGDGAGDTEDTGVYIFLVMGLPVVVVFLFIVLLVVGGVLLVLGAMALIIFRKHQGQNSHQPSPQTSDPVVSATGAATAV